MSWFLACVALLHFAFMIAELFPWKQPFLLSFLVSKKLPEKERFTKVQQEFVATIVHNAGVYNGILAGGLFWASFAGSSGAGVAQVMLWGAVVAGAFGTATLKSPVTAIQAVAGIVGLVLN